MAADEAENPRYKTLARHLSRRYRVAAEGVGRRLMDRIESMIPDALAEHFGK